MGGTKNKTYAALVATMVIGFVVCVFAPVAHAQVITTPYWCGSYWSSTPCNYNGYGGYNNYYGNQNYGYGYPYGNYNYYNSYPYQYQYQYGYPYQNYQYYSYPAPTCSITYSNTNNPNYFGGMYNEAIQLTWSSNYATSAYISGIGSVSQSGTRVVYPYGYTQYTMSVYGPGGSNTCTTYYQPTQYYQPYQQQYYWNQYQYNYGYNYGYPYAW